MAGKKSADFNKEGIERLSKNKPVVYQIENSKGDNLYTGVARRGHVTDRIKEHLPGAKYAIRGGTKVRIQQKPSIVDALRTEARIIKRQHPLQNTKGKYARSVRAAPKTGTKGRAETKRAVKWVTSYGSRKK